MEREIKLAYLHLYVKFGKDETNERHNYLDHYIVRLVSEKFNKTEAEIREILIK